MQLGDITLDRVVGRGGMAVVWLGTSGPDHLPVAVKILEESDDPIQTRRFHDEVRAVARLRHHNIVDVVEMGLVPDSVEDEGLGLRPGSPWLAMEYIPGGTLREAARNLGWHDIRNLLTQLLSALSHAHARGVIHRDLKPANLLVTRVDNVPELHVSDFGIAYTRGMHERDSAFEGRVAGTPRYMAPEQIEGRWRDHGPWTDLYAVGCLAYWLVTAHTPFGGDSVAEILRGQLYGTVEAVEAAQPVPRGFDRWVGSLLRKDAADRYRSAADAAYGLARLGDVEFTGSFWDNDDVQDEDVTQAFTHRQWATIERQRSDRSTLEITPGTLERPPVPLSWRTGPDEEAAQHPGLSLFALRTTPFVGRDEMRDRVWAALREAVTEREPRLLLLEGRAGAGKSRLAEWMGERAAELGAATRLQAHHDSTASPGSGLGTMLARHLECAGLSVTDGEERLRNWWAKHGGIDQHALHDIRVLAGYMPLDAAKRRDSGLHVSLGNPVPSFERALRVIAKERALYLWLDDFVWDQTAIDFVDQVLSATNLPLLLVGTIQIDSLGALEHGDRIAELARRPRAQRIAVGALDPSSERELIGQMLDLDAPTIDELARRAGGNPLFAVQLVDECVERSAFSLQDGRLSLTSGDLLSLPRDVGEVWLNRVAHALAPLDETSKRIAWETLELAAALGEDVEDAQLRHACNLADLPINEQLFERLLDSRLVERVEGRWSFVHSTLRAVLEDRARGGNRWRQICQVCAESVRWFGARAFGELERRRAEYFLHGGARHSALTPLLEAAQRKLEAGRVGEATRLRVRHAALCDDLDLAKTDPQRVRNHMVRAQAALLATEVDEAVAWGRIALAGARENKDPGMLADVLQLRGAVMRHRDMDEAVGAFDEAIALLADTADPRARVKAMTAAATARCHHPAVARAVELAEDLVVLSEGLSDSMRAHSHWVRALASRQTGEFAAALEDLDTAHRLATEQQRTLLAARCEMARSRVCRLTGDDGDAQRWAQLARNTVRSYGPQITALADLELALAFWPRWEDDRTSIEIQQALERAGLLQTDVVGAEARFSLATIAARRHDFEAFERWVAVGRPAVEVGAFDRCLARAIDAAAEVAAEHGHADLAGPLWALAEMQWRRLGTQTVSPRE